MPVDLGRQGPLITRQNDQRLTRVGRWLAKTKLDELPQLINVLRGEMSAVGPRPEVPKFTSYYPDRWDIVLSVKPGIFGASQNQFRNEALLYIDQDHNLEKFYVDAVLPLKLELDEAYVRQSGLLMDFSLIFFGLFAVFSGNQPVTDARQSSPHPKTSIGKDSAGELR